MRPLNRPMFRYGGPIKEGIMDGMREPLKNGGLSKQFNTGLVGDERYPKTDGREHHFAFLAPAGMAALRFLPAAVRGFKATRAYTPFSQNLGVAGRLKDIFKPRGGLKLESGKLGPKTLAGEGAGFRVGSFLRQNPLTTLPIAGMAIEGGGRAAAGLAKMTPDLLRQYANAVIPFADPFTKKEKDIATTEGGTGVKRGDPNKDKVVPSPDTGGTGGKSDAEKQIINEDRINETKQKYYKLMGLDNMKKDAVYDSLIDASRIVSEEGEDLKGSIKSGALQNRLIQAIGKNLDKSADLKKAIDSAVLKGEIQKDINLTKPSAFAEQVAYLRNNPNDPLARKLSGVTSVADNIAALSDKPLTSDIVSRLVESKGQEVAGTIKDDKYQKWEKNNEGKDEIDYLQEITKGKSLDAGIYIINKKAVRIDEDGEAFPVDLDSIIG